MRPALLFSAAFFATIIALAAACGGSSSETPWPVEPDPGAIATTPHLQPLTEEDGGARKR
jgi:hypothetical protein